MKNLTAAIALMGVLSAPAMADNYAGVQYSMATYDETGVIGTTPYSASADPKALVGIIGYGVNDNLAIEARAGFGLSSGSASVLGTNVDIKIDRFLSVFAKGIAPISPSVKAYGLIGFTDGEITASVGSTSVSASESDMSYGAGIEFGTGKTTGVLEYVQYIDKNNGKLSSLNVGANFKF